MHKGMPLCMPPPRPRLAPALPFMTSNPHAITIVLPQGAERLHSVIASESHPVVWLLCNGSVIVVPTAWDPRATSNITPHYIELGGPGIEVQGMGGGMVPASRCRAWGGHGEDERSRRSMHRGRA